MRRPAAFVAVVALAACTAQQQNSTQNSVNQSVNQLASSAPVAAKDAYLSAAVMTKLAAVDVDATTNVHVSADHGTVTLTGQAHTAAERARYDAAARSVSGVTAVRDRITVGPFEGLRGQANDAQLTVRVAAAIAGQAGANVLHVTPHVHNGNVTLTGTVPSQSVHETILSSVRALSGVRGVVDRIRVQR